MTLRQPDGQRDDARWALDRRFLLHSTITGGLGSAAVGADRGDVGPSLWCRLHQVDDHAVVVALNTTHGMSASSLTHGQTSASFAESALTQCAVDNDSADVSSLGLLDHLDVAQTLTDARGTAFALDPDLSWLESTEWYGDVLALESTLTFRPGIRAPEQPSTNAVSPVGGRPRSLGEPAPTSIVTLRQQVTLRPEPEPGYDEQRFIGTIGAMNSLVVHRFDDIDVRDAWRPLAQRFRLTPGRHDLPAIEFVVDHEIPVDLRARIVAGGNWWAEAFDAAGYPGAFVVRESTGPRDLVDPRHSVVLWTHRDDRGWSWGLNHHDPRTGEVLRGIVRLGSQRVEQVRMLSEAFLGSQSDAAAEVSRVVEARMAVLGAHEIGHSLGLAHNFASHRHPRPSVMDYPAPAFDVQDGRVVALPEVYAERLGPWDHWQIDALYNKRPVDDPDRPDLDFVTDADSRGDEAGEACGATWVTPGEPLEALDRVMAARAAAMAAFSPACAPLDSDAFDLAQRFTLLYLSHRHQALAAVKLIGGVTRRYAHRTDRGYDGEVRPVPTDRQRHALQRVAALLEPETLRIPDSARELLAPPAGGVRPRGGSFPGRTAGVCDVAETVAGAVDVVVGALLHPARLNRVRDQELAGKGISLRELLDAVVVAPVARLDSAAGVESEVAGWTVLRRLLEVASSDALHPHVRIALDEAFNVGSPRAAVERQVQAVRAALRDSSGPLPEIPLGTPI